MGLVKTTTTGQQHASQVIEFGAKFEIRANFHPTKFDESWYGYGNTAILYKILHLQKMFSNMHIYFSTYHNILH